MITQVFSVRITTDKETKVPQLIALPQLQRLLESGWELIKALPVKRYDLSYLFTFVLKQTNASVNKRANYINIQPTQSSMRLVDQNFQ